MGKLSWFDRVFCSPSNHRVHHAVNDEYLDKNYADILIVWDRLFGTFHEESQTCVYGTRAPLKSWDPLWANAQIYAGLLKESWLAKSWRVPPAVVRRSTAQRDAGGGLLVRR